MAKGCYSIERVSNENGIFDLDFAFYDDIGDESSIPEDQRILRLNIEQTLIVLKSLFTKEIASYNEYFDQVFSLATAGLGADPAAPHMANEALCSLKEEILIREGGKIKNKYIFDLGIVSIKFFCTLLIVAALFQGSASWCEEAWSNALLLGRNFSLVWMGAVVGIWVSFCARKIELKFEELHVIDSDRLEPIVRIMFVGLLATIIGLLFSTEAITVKIGSLSSNMINTNPQVAFLIGCLLGFCEKVLALKVSEQARAMIKF